MEIATKRMLEEAELKRTMAVGLKKLHDVDLKMTMVGTQRGMSTTNTH